MRSLRCSAALAVLVLSACEVVVPSNPFDPEAPEDVQARGGIAGVVQLDNPLDEATRQRQLDALRVGLFDASGRRVSRDGEVLAVALKNVDPTTSTGSFSIDDLTPGTYAIVVDGVPSFYALPSLATVSVLPGGTTQVDPIVFSYVDNGDEGPGRISGEVVAASGALGTVNASLFARRDGQTTLVKAVIGEGGFDFPGLAPGSYAVVVENDGFTPAYRLDVQVDDTATATLVHAFTGEERIVVQPVSAALLPKIPSEGLVVSGDDIFLRRDDVPVAVLSFAEQDIADVGVTGMRLSSSEAFVDDAGEPLLFSAFNPDAIVAIPPVDGSVKVFAQFEARSTLGFVFTSPSFALELVRDRTPPEVVEATVLGLSRADDGAYLSSTRQVTLRVDGTDATSGLAALRAGFDSSETVGASVVPGQQRLQKDATAADDGRLQLRYALVDRAGNETDEQVIDVIVDTVAPRVALDVVGVDDGLLRGRTATLRITSQVAGDDALAVAVGLEGEVDEGDLGPLGDRLVTIPANVAHGASVTFEAVAFDVVGNSQRVTRTLTLDLRGVVSGAIVSDDPATAGSIAGAEVTLTDATGAVVDSRTVDDAGTFLFAAVPEGRGYVLSARFAGHADASVRNIAVFQGDALDVGTVVLPLLRGDVRGIARRSDLDDDDAAHAGIQVSLRLVSQGRSFQSGAFTDPAGAFVLRGVPRTLLGEQLRVVASATEYGLASITTTLAGDSVDVGTLSLARSRGDFDVCATSDPLCTPLRFVRDATVDVRLRDTVGVVAVVVSRNGLPSVRLPLGDQGRASVAIDELADGVVTLTVQAEKEDGGLGAALSAAVVKDTVAPDSVALVRQAAPAALDARFTSDDAVNVTITADAGDGDVAPLAPARVLVDERSALPPTSGFTACDNGELCRVRLPFGDERRFDLIAWACDAAGNCAAPVETFVIRDDSPPSVANGATFSIRAPGGILEGGIHILPTPLYRGVFGLGRAETSAGDVVVDDNGEPVADVFGVQLSLSSETLSRAAVQTFADPPVSDAVRDGADIAVPPLANDEGEQTVTARFIDAAGNASDEVSVRVVIDVSPPAAFVAINGGAPTNATSVPFTVSVPDGAEAPRSVRLVVDPLPAQSFLLPLVDARLLLPAVDGALPVTVQLVDRVGNVSAAQQTVLRDTSAPSVLGARCISPTCTDDGFGLLLSRAEDARVDLVLQTTDALTAVADVEITFSPTLAAAPTQVFTVPPDGRIDGVLLPANNNAEMIIKPIDVVGNEGVPFKRLVRHDVTGPVIVAFVVEPDDAGTGAAITRKTTLDIAIDVPAGDAVRMALAPSTTFSGATVEFAARTTFAIAGADGSRQVCVQVEDAAGNKSVACDSIVLDRTVPQGSVSVATTVTRAATVTATLTMPADTVRVGASATGACTMTAATPPVDDLVVALGEGDGPRTIVACFEDAAGNTATATAQQTVLRDTSAPSVLGARCISPTCTDDGFGLLLSRAEDARVDLVLQTTDALTAVADVEITFSPTLAAAPTQVFTVPPDGRIDGVLLPANNNAEMIIKPIDVVGNEGVPFKRLVRHDVTGPVIVAFVVEPDDAGTGAAITRKTTLDIAIDVPAGDAVRMALAPSTTFSGATVEFAARTTFAIAGADGSRQVCVQVEDAAGNKSVACDSIVLDRTVPQGSVSVATTVTRSATVTATLTMPADTVRVGASATGVCTMTAATPPVDDLVVALGEGDGPRTILACFEDAAGNTATATTTLAVDRSAPSVALSLSGPFSNVPSTTASLQASPDAAEMAIAVNAALDCAAAAYEPFATSKAVTLGPDATYVVRACVRDAAGNTSGSTATASIVVDTIRPTTSVSLNTGALFTRSAVATLTLSASSDVTQVAVANAASLNCATAAYTTFQSTLPHTLSAGDGSKSVSVCVKDASGLVSAASALATITVDTTPPTGTLVVAGGALSTSISPVAATLTFDADVAAISLTTSPTNQACSQAADPTTTTTTVPLLPNINNVVMLCLVDRAGNLSAPIRRNIFFENAAGADLVIAIDGGAAATRRRTNVPVALFRPSTEFDQMKVVEAPSLDCSIGSGYVAFQETFTLAALSSGEAPAEGTRVVSACIRKSSDVTQTKSASDTIFLDTFAPEGSATIIGDLSASPTVAVTLENNFATEVVQIAFSETSSVVSGGDCTGSFESFSAARAFTFSPGDGTRSLFVCLRDQAGNTRELTDNVLLDTTPPSPVTLSVPALTRTQTINVGLTFPADARQFVLGEGAIDCVTAQGYAAVPTAPSPTTPFTLSATDGAKLIVGCFKDAAGNTSQTTATTSLDRTGPTGVVVLDGGAPFSTDLEVSVAVANVVDAVRMARVESAGPVDCTAQTYVAFVSPLDLTLSAGDGTKTVHVCLEDAAGNRAAALADSIVVDRTAPNGTVVIDGGATATPRRNVTLAIDVGSNVDVVAFAAAEASIACNAANLAYQPLSTQAPFLLSSADATKTVLVCLKDQAGNVSTVAASDTIVLDTAAPAGASVAINDGDGFLQGETTIPVVLSWSTTGDVAAVKLGEGGADCQTSSGYVAVSGTSSTQNLAVSSGDGSKLALACFKDAAGNIVTASDTTLRDTTAPVVTSLSCTDCVVDGTSFLSVDANVVLAVSADEAGSGLASARVAVDGGAESTIALVNGTVTVGGLAPGAHVVRVKLADRAGNVSAVARDLSVTFDDAAPAIDQLLVNGSRAADNVTRSRNVIVTLVGSFTDVAAMAVAQATGTSAALASCTNATYAPFVAEFSLTLPTGDGDKTISVCLQDRAGNRSAAPASTTIRLDTVPPSLPATAVVIQDGDGFLQAETTVSVALSWTTNGDARRAKVAEGVVDCASSDGYVDLPTAANTTTLAGVPVSSGDGTKALAVCFRDLAGNATLAQDTTIRDNTAPTVTSVVCPGCTQDGATLLAAASTLALTVGFDETGSGIQDARFAIDAGADTTAVVANGVVTVAGLSDGTRAIRVKLRDRAGNTSADAQAKTLTVVVDTARPELAAGGLRLNGAASGGSTNSATVNASLTGAPADAVAMALVEAASAPSCAAASYVPLATSTSFTLSADTQGTKTVFACLRDRAGNTSTTATSATITFDTVPPSLPATAVVIQDGDGFLQAETTVSVALSWTTNGDARRAKVAEGVVDCASSDGYVDLPTAANTTTLAGVPVSSGDGTKALAVCFRDLAGNATLAQDTTIRDNTAPTVTALLCPGCTQDGATTLSTSGSVVLAVAFDESGAGIQDARVAIDGGTEATFSVTGGTVSVGGLADGARAIRVKLRDRAGNVSSDAQAKTLTVVVDTARPELAAGGLRLNGAASGGATNNATVVASLNGVPADAVAMALVEAASAPSCAAASYVPLATSTPLSLSSDTQGAKTVFACLRDRAGNTSASATSATITFDTVPPSLVAVPVAVQDGDGFLQAETTVSVLLRWTTAGDVVGFKIAEGGVDCSSEPYERPALSAVNQFTRTALPLSSLDGTKAVFVCFKDAAGNIATGSDTTVRDQAGPSGSVIVAGAAAFTTSEDVSVTLRMEPGTARFALVESADGSCTTSTSNCSSATYTTVSGATLIDGVLVQTVARNLLGSPASQGGKCFEACFEDGAGNRTSLPSFDDIVFDSVRPTLTSLSINGGATATRDRNVTATIAGASADAGLMAIATVAGAGPAIADCANATYGPFAASTTVTLPAGDGAKAVSVCLKDGAGNVTTTATTATTTLDGTPPQNAGVTINNGDARTRSTAATLTLSLLVAEQASTKVQVATDGVPDTEPLEDFATTRSVTLPSGDGSKSVVVRFRDAAGNELVVSDSIDLDATAPTGGAVSINRGAAVTNNTTVTLTLTPPADAVEMSVSGGPFVAVSSTVLATISSDDCSPGTQCKSVSVVFRDAAGNEGSAVSDTIELDTAPPAGASMTLTSSNTNDTTGFTTSGVVSAALTFTAGAGQATQVKHGEGAVDCSTASGYAALSASPTTLSGLSLSAGDGQKAYVACFKDAAGNVASVAANIVVDRSRPFGAISINDGAATTTSTSVTMHVIPGTDDATRVAFVNAASAPDCAAVSAGSFSSVAPTMAHTLSTVDGSKTVFACFRDTAGNVSSLPISDQITLDTTVPSVAVAVSGNASAQTGQTNTLVVLVTVTSLLADTRALAFAEGTLGCANASFEPVAQPVPASITRSFVLANTGDGARTVSVCAQDAAGNLSGTNGATATINVDTTPPQVALSIAGGAAFATSTTVNVSQSSTPSSDLLASVVSQDPAIDCSTRTYGTSFATLGASFTQTLSSTDGEKFVTVCYADRAGNISRASDSIQLDTTRPAATLALAQGAAFATGTTVTTDFANVSADVTQFARTNGATLDCATATYTAFVNGTNFTLTATDGRRDVAVCLRDAAGNTTLVTDSIVLDRVAPTVAFTLSRRGGDAPVAGFTNTRDVLLNVSSVSNDVIAFAIANTTIDCGTVSYDAAPSPLPALPFVREFTLAAGADGTRTVAVCVKDASGQTNGATGTSSSITLDTVPPQISTFVINGGATITNNASVTVTQASSPSNDLLRFSALSRAATLSCDAVTFTGTFDVLPATRAGELLNESGQESASRTLAGCYQDRAGNTALAADEIVFDDDRPNFASRPVCSSCTLIDAAPSFAETFGDTYLGYTNETTTSSFEVSTSAVDLAFVLAMATTDTNQSDGGLGQDRSCTSDANCVTSIGETCEDFPIVDNPLTFGRRCAIATPATIAVVAPIIAVDGRNAIVFALEDDAGNLSNGRNVYVVRDTVAPTISYALNTTLVKDPTVFVRELTVSGEPAPPSAVAQIGSFQASNLITFADAPELPFRVTASPFRLTDAIPVGLSAGDGAKTVRVRFIDNAGNAATVVESTVIVDSTPPSTPQFAGAGGTTSAGQFPIGALSVASTDSNGMRPSRPYNILLPPVANGTTTCSAVNAILGATSTGECEWNGTTTFNISLPEGENRVQVRGVDAAGNFSAADVLLVDVDRTAPNAVLITDAVVRSESVTLKFAVEPGLAVSSDTVGLLVHYGDRVDGSGNVVDGNFANQGASPIFLPSSAPGQLPAALTLSGLTNLTTAFLQVRAVDDANLSSARRGQTAGSTTALQVQPSDVSLDDLIDETTSPSAGASLVARDGRLFVLTTVDGIGAVCAYDITDPAAPVTRLANENCLASASISATADRLRLSGRFLYLTRNAGSVRAINISNPSRLSSQTVTEVVAAGSVDDIAVVGREAIAARAGSSSLGTNSAVMVLRKADSTTAVGPSLVVPTSGAGIPFAPANSAHHCTRSTAFTSIISCSVEVAAAENRAVVLVKKSDNDILAPVREDYLWFPNLPVSSTSTSISSVPSTLISDDGSTLSVAIGGGKLYVGRTEGILIYNMPSPGFALNATSNVGEIAGFTCNDMAITPGYVYCNSATTNGPTRLTVVDVSDPTRPFVAGQSPIDASRAALQAFTVDKNIIAGATTAGRLAMMELWTPARLLPGASGVGAGYERGIALGTGHVMIGDDGVALDTFRTNDPATLDGIGSFEYNGGLLTVFVGHEPFLRAFGNWALFVDPNDASRAFDVFDPFSSPSAVLRSVNRLTTGACADSGTPDSTVDMQVSGELGVVLAIDGDSGAPRVEIWSLRARDASGNWNPTCVSRATLSTATPPVPFNKLSNIVDSILFASSPTGALAEIDLALVLTTQVPTIGATTTGALVNVSTTDAQNFSGLELAIAMPPSTAIASIDDNGSGGTVIVTTATAHGLVVGDRVDIIGVDGDVAPNNGTYNNLAGTPYVITQVISTTQVRTSNVDPGADNDNVVTNRGTIAAVRSVRVLSGRNDEVTGTNDLVVLARGVNTTVSFATLASAPGAFGAVARAGRHVFVADGTRTQPFGTTPSPGHVNGLFAMTSTLSATATTQSVRTPWTILPIGPYVFLFGETGLQTLRPTR
jgi:hypothetical protein